MFYFSLRIISLLIRFLGPIFVLALSSPDVMGQYYVFIGFFAFISGISGVECSTYFSEKYLQFSTHKYKTTVFSRFLFTLVLISFVVSCIFGFSFSGLANIRNFMVPLFCFTLFTEACINELSRFFNNIGEWRYLSARDICRSLIFFLALIIPLIWNSNIPSIGFFVLIIFGNTTIFCFEFRKFASCAAMINIFKSLRSFRELRLFFLPIMSRSFPQFTQVQILSIFPLLERILLERYAGFAIVASYSFCSTFIQSVGGLQLLPSITNIRQFIFSSSTSKDLAISASKSLVLFFKISFVCAFWSVICYVFIPLLSTYFGKTLELTPSIVLVAFFSSTSAIFSSSISPYFLLRGVAWLNNVFSIISPFVLAIPIYATSSIPFTSSALLIIILAAFFQFSTRFFLIFTSARNLFPRFGL